MQQRRDICTLHSYYVYLVNDYMDQENKKDNAQAESKSEFGIMVFGHTRTLILADLLESLNRQGAIHYVDLWVDGYQGKTDLKNKVAQTRKVGDDYAVGVRRYHQGQLGFRKLMLQAMQSAVRRYENILFLEDDCFPNRAAVDTFREDLEKVRDDDTVFSVYGHHFGLAEDGGRCSRFQGWGWATTATKLSPYVDRLIELYSISEQDYLDFTTGALTPEVRARLDVTPPRLPTDTLVNFFAWDETLALLTAMDGKWHVPTSERVIYNCGMGDGSAHFSNHQIFLNPPFNLIRPDQVWDYF